MNRKSLCGLSLDEIVQISGTDLLHATTIANCLYKRRVTDIDQFKGISKQLRKELKEIY